MNFILQTDLALFYFINGQLSSRILDPLMIFLTYLGRLAWIMLLPWVYMMWKGNKKTRLFGWFLLLLIACTDMIPTYVLKPFFERVRPVFEFGDVRLVVPPHNSLSRYGFPSNHAANLFGCATFISLFLSKRKWTWGLFLTAFLISFSRVYIGFHTPLDVVAGAVLGSTLGVAFYWIFKKTCYT